MLARINNQILVYQKITYSSKINTHETTHFGRSHFYWHEIHSNCLESQAAPKSALSAESRATQSAHLTTYLEQK